MKGSKAYQFAHIDPKSLKIGFAYAHISCGDKYMQSQGGGPVLVTDDQIRKFWSGMVRLQKKLSA
jgi:hypothetical protein